MKPSDTRRFERLSAAHERNGFTCEQPTLVRFLRERALHDMRSRVSVTHALVAEDSRAIIGYHTLAAASIPFGNIPEPERKKARLSRYAEMSATLIARLARDQRWKGNGVGELLLMDALRRAYIQTAHIGAAFVVVDAIDAQAGSFYGRYGFLPLDEIPGKLFMAMATIGRLVSPWGTG